MKKSILVTIAFTLFGQHTLANNFRKLTITGETAEAICYELEKINKTEQLYNIDPNDQSVFEFNGVLSLDTKVLTCTNGKVILEYTKGDL